MSIENQPNTPIPSCPESQEWQEVAEGVVALLNESSEVAFTLVAASILEDQVLRTLRKVLPETNESEPHVRRVHLLRKMGLITGPVAMALEKFASIRNKFAHKPHKTTFDDCEVLKRESELRKQLELECGKAEFAAVQGPFHAAIDRKHHDVGGKPRWTHPVARTLVSGYLVLTYYLIWARHWAPNPQTPKNINEIAKHKCAKPNSKISNNA